MYNNFMSFILLAADATAEVDPNTLSSDPVGANFLNLLATFGPIALIAVGFWFFLIRPQKKQEKEVQKMRSSIDVGDSVTTIGGITGVVRQIKDDDTFIIETGADKSKISIKKWAIQTKDTISDTK